VHTARVLGIVITITIILIIILMTALPVCCLQTARALGYRVVRVGFEAVDAPLFGEGEGAAPVLFVVPFYELSAGLVDMHDVDDRGNCEATHFCYSPYVWEHVFDRVARALQMVGWGPGGDGDSHGRRRAEEAGPLRRWIARRRGRRKP
jgi:hypothetical protein